MLWNADELGVLQGVHTLVENTSGNTGLGLLALARRPPFNIPNVRLIVQPDLADGKRGPLVLRGATFAEPEGELSGVATARKIGGGGWKPGNDWRADQGILNLDQYGNPLNSLFHRLRTGPNILEQEPGITIFCCGFGTGGTGIGVGDYLRSQLENITIVGGLCAPGQKIPGIRDRERMKDITLPWEETISPGACIEMGTRVSYLATLWLLWFSIESLGPSTGFAWMCLLQFLHQQKEAGVLDKHRNKRGKIKAVVLGPDTYRPYIDHFHANLPGDWIRRSKAPLPWTLLW